MKEFLEMNCLKIGIVFVGKFLCLWEIVLKHWLPQKSVQDFFCGMKNVRFQLQLVFPINVSVREVSQVVRCLKRSSNTLYKILFNMKYNFSKNLLNDLIFFYSWSVYHSLWRFLNLLWKFELTCGDIKSHAIFIQEFMLRTWWTAPEGIKTASPLHWIIYLPRHPAASSLFLRSKNFFKNIFKTKIIDLFKEKYFYISWTGKYMTIFSNLLLCTYLDHESDHFPSPSCIAFGLGLS